MGTQRERVKGSEPSGAPVVRLKAWCKAVVRDWFLSGVRDPKLLKGALREGAPTIFFGLKTGFLRG